MPKVRKSLADHQFTIGTQTQQRVFATVAEYLINYIRKTYVNGDDIAQALEQRMHMISRQKNQNLNLLQTKVYKRQQKSSIKQR
jgi:hypothetical protein